MAPLLILSASNVDEIITKFKADDLVSLMATVFFELAASHSTQASSSPEKPSPNPGTKSSSVTIPHRATVATANHTVLFMPSRVSAIGTAIKIVSVPSGSAPKNVLAHGLPGSTMVIDEHTGDVTAVVNARKLTALRNAASSLLATRIMLPPETSRPVNIVAIGAGAQIHAHLSLFLSAYPSITSCKIYNRTMNDRLTGVADSLRRQYSQVDVEHMALPSPECSEDQQFVESLRAANIIVTATSSTTPLFPASYISPGTHLCLIGSYKPTMHEVDTALVKRAGKIVVDYKEGASVEAGELLAAQTDPADILELGQLISIPTSTPTSSADTPSTSSPPNPNPHWTPRTDIVDTVRSSGDVTIFKSVGVGVQDVAIAHAVVGYAREHGIGTVVDDYDDA